MAPPKHRLDRPPDFRDTFYDTTDLHPEDLIGELTHDEIDQLFCDDGLQSLVHRLDKALDWNGFHLTIARGPRPPRP